MNHFKRISTIFEFLKKEGMKKETDWMALIIRITFVILFFGLIYSFDSVNVNSENEKNYPTEVEKRIEASSAEEFSQIKPIDSMSDSSSQEVKEIKLEINNKPFKNIMIMGLTAIALIVTLIVSCIIASRV